MILVVTLLLIYSSLNFAPKLNRGPLYEKLHPIYTSLLDGTEKDWMKGKQLFLEFFLKHALIVFDPSISFYHKWKYAAFDIYSLALGILIGRSP